MSHLPDPDTQPEFYSGVASKRFLAWIVDTLAILLVAIAIVPLTAFTGLFFFPFLVMCVGFVYRTLTLTTQSATWGMRLLAIEFRTQDGARFGFDTAVLHTLGFSASLTVFPAQVISIVLMLTSARGQGLTDHVLGTVAVNKRAVLA